MLLSFKKEVLFICFSANAFYGYFDNIGNIEAFFDGYHSLGHKVRGIFIDKSDKSGSFFLAAYTLGCSEGYGAGIFCGKTLGDNNGLCDNGEAYMAVVGNVSQLVTDA